MMIRRMKMAVVGLFALGGMSCGYAEESLPLQFADPFVYAENGTYYAYGTWARDGLAVATSTDLKNWSIAKDLVLKKGDGVYGTRHFWAPEVYKIDGRYILLYTASEGEQNGKYNGICIAESDSPLGPFRSRVARPLIERDGSLDNSLFIDDDGKAYMLFAHYVTGAAVWIAPFDLKTLKLDYKSAKAIMRSTHPWEIPADVKSKCRTCEGPFIVKEKGIYYLTYSTHTYEDQDYNVCLATATSINGPWVKRGCRPILTRHDGMYGTGHHSFFRDLSGKWKIAFHSHPSAFAHEVRKMHTADANFLTDPENPWIEIGMSTPAMLAPAK